jgi:hypothetical protein
MLNEKQILEQWGEFISLIENEIAEPRKSKLIDFYNKYEERFILMPASMRPQYHNCFPGGYIDHVLRVVKASIDLYQVWMNSGITPNFTREETVFSALNHDLGKFGTFTQESYIPNPSEWHVKNKGEIYTFNSEIEFMSVPDRSLWILNQLGLNVSKNEYLSIKLHDGLYDDANKSYLISWGPETKLRTSLPYIIHQADLLASRIEFEREWLHKFEKGTKNATKDVIKNTTTTTIVTENITEEKVAGITPQKQPDKIINNGSKLDDIMANFFN